MCNLWENETPPPAIAAWLAADTPKLDPETERRREGDRRAVERWRVTDRRALAFGFGLAFGLLIASAAHATDLRITYQEFRTGYDAERCWNCIPDRTPAQEARFQEICKPHEKRDSLGAVRLSYARKGCEYGFAPE